MEGLLYTIVTKEGAEMKKPEAKVTHVGLKDVSLEYITYNAKLSVTNSCSVPVSILDTSYTLKNANREIASGTNMELGGSLKENDTIILDVEMNVVHGKLLSLVREIDVDWDIDHDLLINFALNVHIDY